MVATIFNSRTIKKRELTHGHEGNEGGGETRSSKKKRAMRVQREIKSRTYRERRGARAKKRANRQYWWNIGHSIAVVTGVTPGKGNQYWQQWLTGQHIALRVCKYGLVCALIMHTLALSMWATACLCEGRMQGCKIKKLNIHRKNELNCQLFW